MIGLATLLVAALMLTVTGDVKRMLAYSSMENMGLIAIAAAAGTTLAIAALLLHVLAHGIGKTVLFLAGGQLQAAHGSTAIADITGVVRRSRLIGASFAVGLIVLLGLPPFAMFASELAIARSLADARLAWVLGAAMLLIAVAFAALVRNSGRMLLGAPAAAAPTIAVPATVAAALLVGVTASIALGVTAGPLTDLFTTAASHARSRPMKPNWLRHRLSRDELAGKAEELLAEGFRLGLVAAHDDGDRLRVVYLFLAGRPGPPCRARMLSARSAIRRCRRWRICPSRRAASSAKCPTCTGSGRSGIPAHAGWSATRTGPKTGIRCAPTPGPHRSSRRPGASRSSPSKAPGCMRSRSARCTPG